MQEILQIEPSSSLLKLDLPIGNEIFRSCVEVSKIEESKIRSFLYRWRRFSEVEREIKNKNLSSLSREELEKQEQEFFTYQEYVLSLTREIFSLESVKFLSVLENSEGKKLTKEDLSLWLEGDFLFVWGKLFYYLLESNRISLKKK